VYVLGFALFGCGGPSRQAQDPAAFYQGRTLRIIVGVSPGGGQDLYARIMAAHFSRYLPGQPNIIVENMPGAGGLIAANYMARRANPDGLTIGLLGIQAVLAQLLTEAPQFDIRDLPIIGSPADDGTVCAFTRDSGFSLDAWRHGRVARLGMTNRGSTTDS
jgi:tripartite-type tricarboxylate transporter receptor subunit TctC